VPKARIAAEHQLADAQVYASQTLANAQGEAERFTQLANAYSQAPEVTRNRMYTETMETILSRSHKIIVDAKSPGGNLIYLPLDKLAEAMKSANSPPANPPPANPPPANPPSPANAGAGAGAANAGAGNTDRGDQDDRGRDRTDR
jgi:membrane protease subunit HflK